MVAVEQFPKGRIRRRLTLMHDGRPFLERWGLCHERLGGFYLHKIAGPDPGLDLHDHPWTFVSVVLWGGYTELRAATGQAVDLAEIASRFPDTCTPGYVNERHAFSVRRMKLTVCHRIVAVLPGTWTLVLRGPTRRKWGFYLPAGRVPWTEYPYEQRRPSTAAGNHIE